MTKLEQLIQEKCPNGVEYKKIGDICETITDYTAAGSFADIAKNVQYNNNKDYALLVRTTDLKSNFENPDKFIYVNEHAYNYLWRVQLKEDSLVLPNIGNCGEAYYISSNTLPLDKCVLGPNAIYVRSETIDNRYFYHAYLSKEFQYKLRKIVSPSGQTKFNKTDLKQLTLPVPPLEVQREIVEILDKFTLLTAELTAELTARKEQFDNYKDNLMKTNAKYYCLKDLCLKITDGMHNLPKGLLNEGKYPVLSAQNITNGLITVISSKYASEEVFDIENKRTHVEENDILMTIVGAIGRIAIVPKGLKALFQRSVCIMKPNHDLINSKYLKYILESTNTQSIININAHGAAQKGIYLKDVNNIKIPVPTIEEQQRIVDILDRFDTLCNDISSGLPAEIVARQKQYEYYRDKLLTFKRYETN